MKLLQMSQLEIKKSKFIAYAYEVSSSTEVKEIWTSLKTEHKHARHIPYAYLLDNTGGKSDDKEPSGTAGMPIYHLLEVNHNTNKAIFVVRYFGGIKLGAGGLIRAYKNAAASVIEKCL